MRITKDLAYLLGVIGGDGTIYIKKGKEYTIRIYDKSEEFIKKVLQPLIEKTFNTKTHVRFVKERNSWYLTLRSKKIVELITKKSNYSVGKSKTYSDHIPPQIINSSKEIILHHIGGWIDAEGHVRIHSTPRIELETVNKNFAEELYILSQLAGVESTKPRIARRDYRKDQKKRYVLAWIGSRKCRILLNFIRHPQKIERLKDGLAED
jgi:hypothetical protein